MIRAIVLAAGKGTRMKSDAAEGAARSVRAPDAVVRAARAARGRHRRYRRRDQRRARSAHRRRSAFAASCRRSSSEPDTRSRSRSRRSSRDRRSHRRRLRRHAARHATRSFADVAGARSTATPTVDGARDGADAAAVELRPHRARGGDVERIVEVRDATPAELAIDEMNAGDLRVRRSRAARRRRRICKNDNAQKEYYLTDTVAHFVSAGQARAPGPSGRSPCTCSASTIASSSRSRAAR